MNVTPKGLGAKNATMMTTGDAQGTLGSSGRVRSLWSETIAPFTVLAGAKIPGLSESRREEREERFNNLLRRPKHKELASIKDETNHQYHNDKLMSAPLTM